MKIIAEPKEKYNCIICLQENCKWDGVCANHATAGDFRSEGGPRPLLKLLSGELHCDTFHSPGNGNEFHDEPTNTDPSWFPNRWNMVLWNQLIEEVDNFQI